MIALSLVLLLAGASVFDTVRMLAARPGAAERRVVRALMAGRIGPSTYRARMEALAWGAGAAERAEARLRR